MISPTGDHELKRRGRAHQRLKREEIAVGQNFAVFYTEAGIARKASPAQTLKLRQRKAAFEQESWRVRRDGMHLLNDVVVDAIRDDAGKTAGLLPRSHGILQSATGVWRPQSEPMRRSSSRRRWKRSASSPAALLMTSTTFWRSCVKQCGCACHASAELCRHQSAGRHAARCRARCAPRPSNYSFARQQPLMVEKYDLNSVISSFRIRAAGVIPASRWASAVRV